MSEIEPIHDENIRHSSKRADKRIKREKAKNAWNVATFSVVTGYRLVCQKRKRCNQTLRTLIASFFHLCCSLHLIFTPSSFGACVTHSILYTEDRTKQRRGYYDETTILD